MEVILLGRDPWPTEVLPEGYGRDTGNTAWEILPSLYHTWSVASPHSTPVLRGRTGKVMDHRLAMSSLYWHSESRCLLFTSEHQLTEKMRILKIVALLPSRLFCQVKLVCSRLLQQWDASQPPGTLASWELKPSSGLQKHMHMHMGTLRLRHTCEQKQKS